MRSRGALLWKPHSRTTLLDQRGQQQHLQAAVDPMLSTQSSTDIAKARPQNPSQSNSRYSQGTPEPAYHGEDMGAMCSQQVVTMSSVSPWSSIDVLETLGSIPTPKKGWSSQITLEEHGDISILITCFLFS